MKAFLLAFGLTLGHGVARFILALARAALVLGLAAALYVYKDHPAWSSLFGVTAAHPATNK